MRSVSVWVLCAAAAVVGVPLAIPIWRPQVAQSSSGTRSLVVYGFSVMEDVFKGHLAPAFRREWEARTGRSIQIVSVFGSLGKVTNELLDGTPAHLAFLSPEFGARQLAERGLVAAESWERLPRKGIVTETPFVIVVRPGNPLGVRGFADLTRPGLRIVHSDPKTSGGGYWAILAVYGDAYRRTERQQAGYEQLLGVWRNVAAMGVSAREARTLFENGIGDALITYEQDALFALDKKALQAEIVYPQSTIIAEVSLVTLERNVDPADRSELEAFKTFLWSDGAQRILAENGFRGSAAPGQGEKASFPPIADPFRIRDLGGWKRVRSEIIEGAWRKVLRALGK